MMMEDKLPEALKKDMALRMPKSLWMHLVSNGVDVVLTEEQIAKMEKIRKPMEKQPKWMIQLFSDRQESEDSEVQENSDDAYSDDEE